jgi:hypothetical protein
MAHYLVKAKPVQELLSELRQRLEAGEIEKMEPFGTSLQTSLENARLQKGSIAIWEEEDYCRPPLAQERAAILDTYFNDLRVERVDEGDGWRQIENLPGMFETLLSKQVKK